MKESMIFIFSIGNFSLLLYGLIRIWRKMAHPFFIARSKMIESDIHSSATLLTQAKERFASSSESATRLDSEISVRKNLIRRQAEQECDEMVEEANAQVRRIEENARRQSEGERTQVAAKVRQHVLRGAFHEAESLLKNKFSGALSGQALAKSLSDFSALLDKNRGAQ